MNIEGVNNFSFCETQGIPVAQCSVLAIMLTMYNLDHFHIRRIQYV
jgi:hypothetical protein